MRGAPNPSSTIAAERALLRNTGMAVESNGVTAVLRIKTMRRSRSNCSSSSTMPPKTSAASSSALRSGASIVPRCRIATPPTARNGSTSSATVGADATARAVALAKRSRRRQLIVRGDFRALRDRFAGERKLFEHAFEKLHFFRVASNSVTARRLQWRSNFRVSRCSSADVDVRIADERNDGKIIDDMHGDFGGSLGTGEIESAIGIEDKLAVTCERRD